MKTKQILSLIICLLIPLAIGGISGFVTQGEANGHWFTALDKPSFNPPPYLFAPVWTVLYILMGISLYLIWQSPRTELRKKALRIFVLQLLLNFLWSILFFSLHLLLISVIDIVLLWIMIVVMIITFRKIDPKAGYLQIPYFLWLSFATALDIAIWQLNT